MNEIQTEDKGMKITRERLIKIIKEELQDQGGTPEEQPGVEPEEKKKSDVARVLSYISAIDNRQEYEQLVAAIIKHGGALPGAKIVLTKVYQQLPKFIKTLK
jgi:hypothetical protein